MIAPPSLSELTQEALSLIERIARIAEGQVSILDRDGARLCEFDARAGGNNETTSRPIRIEAEPVGRIVVSARRHKEAAELLAEILHTVYGRKLVSHVYQATLSDSYEELLDRNRELEKLADSLEKQVEQRTRELDEAHARLAREEKVAAIGRLAAGLSHELNTPLACVRSNLNALREINSETEREEFCDIIRESTEMADRVVRIVRDLRTVTHVDDVGRVPVDLNEEIELILARVDVSPGVRIKTDFKPLPALSVDGGSFNVAIIQLLENALDAVGEEGVIRIETQVVGDRIRLTIEDNGCGIPDDVLPRVFDPFFTTKDVGSGTGLGLTVTRDVIRAHGGEVVLESLGDLGTLARVTLPVANEEAQA